ncbi:MAG: HDOD domain-containing protein [Desulfobacula sp.]|nr:HDOD domain-containing protein [Desulfobacula sp.]
MKILVIDDEQISRKVLLKLLAGIGDCTAVDDSLKGLKLATVALQKKKPYDLITMDISMPKMDGLQLLGAIRKKEKSLKIEKVDRMKIVMVTSRMNIFTIKDCIKLGCDGYLSKPVNKYQLMGTLGKMGFTDLPKIKYETQEKQTRIVAQIIKRFYAGKIQLPVLPGIAKEIQDLMENKDPSTRDLVEIVKKDIVISTKLISIANSALYRGIEKVTDLNTALIRLGMKASSSLITTLVAKDMFTSKNKQLNGFLEKLWMHSFACACFAKRLGEELKSKSADSLFLMGIVHDIGKMLLIKAIMDIYPEETFDEDIHIAIHEIHTTFGAVLLKKLRFAKEFLHITEFHHWSDFSKKDGQELLIINLADILANQTGYHFFDGEAVVENEAPIKIEGLKVFKQLGLEEEKIQAMVKEMKTTIKESAKAF